MADYRVRGYMQYARVQGGGAGCADSWVVACGAAGRWLLRQAPGAVKVEGPASGFAIFKGKIIDCPEAIATVTADSNGLNEQANGYFHEDAVSPTLVPGTQFVLLAGGNPNSLQIRTLATQCIYEFTVGGGSCGGWPGGAGACRVLLPAAAPSTHVPRRPCPAPPPSPAAHPGHQLHPGCGAGGVDQLVERRGTRRGVAGGGARGGGLHRGGARRPALTPAAACWLTPPRRRP